MIRSLPSEMDADSLAIALSEYGPVASCQVVERGSGLVGFVQMQEASDTKAVLQQGSRLNIGGHLARVVPKQSQAESQRDVQDSCTIVVDKLPSTVGADVIYDVFQGFGVIEGVKFVRFDDVGHARNGRAFLTFKTPDQAAAAVDAMHMTQHDGADIYVKRVSAATKDTVRTPFEEIQTPRPPAAVNTSNNPFEPVLNMALNPATDCSVLYAYAFDRSCPTEELEAIIHEVVPTASILRGVDRFGIDTACAFIQLHQRSQGTSSVSSVSVCMHYWLTTHCHQLVSYSQHLSVCSTERSSK